MDPSKDLRGRHALVCGASSGIGRATALALAGRGASITALARREERLARLASEVEDLGVAGRFLVVDMDDLPSLRASVEDLLEEDGPIEILVNNSGGPAPGPLLSATEEDLLAGFRRHVLAAHALVKALLPGMRESGFGRIVNIVSTSVREPIPGLGVSNTIRAAMAGWSKTLSLELPPGVTINNVLPGYTATERLRALGESIAERTGTTYEEVERGWIANIPEGRLAEPAETAAAVAFLASPAAAYVRGQSLAVDGGRLRSI